MQIHSQRTASSRCRGRRSRAPTARRRRRRRTTTSTFPSGSNRSSSSRCVLSSSSFFSSAPCFNPPPAPLLAGHGQVVPRPDPLALGRHPRRPEPCRRRPRRDRDPARHALARGGRRVRQDTPGRAEARWRERGQHGQGAPARPSLPPALAAFVRSRRAKEHLHMCAGRAAVRRQRVGRARRRRGRARRARHQVRGQEPQRRALHRLGHRCVLLFLSSSLFSLCTVRSLTRRARRIRGLSPNRPPLVGLARPAVDPRLRRPLELDLPPALQGELARLPLRARPGARRARPRRARAPRAPRRHARATRGGEDAPQGAVPAGKEGGGRARCARGGAGRGRGRGARCGGGRRDRCSGRGAARRGEPGAWRQVVRDARRRAGSQARRQLVRLALPPSLLRRAPPRRRPSSPPRALTDRPFPLLRTLAGSSTPTSASSPAPRSRSPARPSSPPSSAPSSTPSRTSA